MKIGGLQKFSLIDYPGKTAAVVFTQGCNFRCPYCHNPELVYPEQFGALLDNEEVLAFLGSRAGQLDGVVISGGEPTLQDSLPEFLRRVKALGYSAKLDTNGSRPDVIKTLLSEKLLDCVAMDIKAPPLKYAAASGCQNVLPAVLESISLLKSAVIERYFRTTFDKTLLCQDDLSDIKSLCGQVGHSVNECLPVNKTERDAAALLRRYIVDTARIKCLN
jgi:pyruvate formate lyase activating enzyme